MPNDISTWDELEMPYRCDRAMHELVFYSQASSVTILSIRTELDDCPNLVIFRYGAKVFRADQLG